MTSSDAQETLWVWENEEQKYYYEKFDTVRIRVEAEDWDLQKAPQSPNSHAEDGDGHGAVPSHEVVADDANGRGHRGRRAYSLQGTEHGQLDVRRGEAIGQRPYAQDGQAKAKDEASAVSVG